MSTTTRTMTLVLGSGWTVEKLTDRLNDVLTREGFDVRFLTGEVGISTEAVRLGCETDEESAA